MKQPWLLAHDGDPPTHKAPWALLGQPSAARYRMHAVMMAAEACRAPCNRGRHVLWRWTGRGEPGRTACGVGQPVKPGPPLPAALDEASEPAAPACGVGRASESRSRPCFT